VDLAPPLAVHHHPPILHQVVVPNVWCRVQASGLRVEVLGFRFYEIRFRVQGFVSRILGSGYRVKNVVSRVQGFGFRCRGGCCRPGQ